MNERRRVSIQNGMNERQRVNQQHGPRSGGRVAEPAKRAGEGLA